MECRHSNNLLHQMHINVLNTLYTHAYQQASQLHVQFINFMIVDIFFKFPKFLTDLDRASLLDTQSGLFPLDPRSEVHVRVRIPSQV